MAGCASPRRRETLSDQPVQPMSRDPALEPKAVLRSAAARTVQLLSPACSVRSSHAFVLGLAVRVGFRRMLGRTTAVYSAISACPQINVDCIDEAHHVLILA